MQQDNAARMRAPDLQRKPGLGGAILQAIEVPSSPVTGPQATTKLVGAGHTCCQDRTWITVPVSPTPCSGLVQTRPLPSNQGSKGAVLLATPASQAILVHMPNNKQQTNRQ